MLCLKGAENLRTFSIKEIRWQSIGSETSQLLTGQLRPKKSTGSRTPQQQEVLLRQGVSAVASRSEPEGATPVLVRAALALLGANSLNLKACAIAIWQYAQAKNML